MRVFIIIVTLIATNNLYAYEKGKENDKDSVKWYIVHTSGEGAKNKEEITNRSKFVMPNFNCVVLKEYEVKNGTESYDKKMVGKTVGCMNPKTKNWIQFNSLCALTKKISMPMDGIGKARKANSIFLECEYMDNVLPNGKQW